MIVMKFGGTSTQDAAAQSNVASIVKANLTRSPIVVISAIAQATNYLERAGKHAELGNIEESEKLLAELFERHHRILDTNVSTPGRHATVKEALDRSLQELRELVRGVAILRELTPRTLDTFYSYGELLSSRLIAATCQEQGIDAVWLDTKEFMLTDENHNRALPIMEVVEERLSTLALPLLQQGKVIVTQGFIGVTPKGFRTTMGRESSDYSGTIIGAALRAENIQIWTDVDGILTSDPRIVQTPKKVKTMLPEEAFELSYYGAKVLHANSMLPALERNIPVYIFNSKRPHLSGTRVASDASKESMLKSIAYKRGMVILTVTPQKRVTQYMLWENVYNVLTRHSAAALTTVTSEFNLAIVLDPKANIEAIHHDLTAIGEVTVFNGKAIITLVGYGIKHVPDFLQRMFQALTGTGISLLSFGASESNITLVVDDETVLDSVKRLHAEFFEGTFNPDVFEQLEHFQTAS